MKATRPDTRPSVADGWAGAEMRVFPLFDSMVTDGPTDRPTDRRTDKASYKVACPQLKREKEKRIIKPELYTGSSISFDTKRTYIVQKRINFTVWFFFLMKELHMTFFVSKFHGTESISLGDILFLSVRYHYEMWGLVWFWGMHLSSLNCSHF